MSEIWVSLAVLCFSWAILLFASAQQRRTRALMNRIDTLLQEIKDINAGTEQVTKNGQ